VANHKAGVEWNPRGGDVASYSAAGTSSPPPPPAAMPAAKAAAPAAAPAGGMNALFGELSKGLDVTKGLKKVTKDQQTWRSEFKGGDAPAPVPQPKPKVNPRVADGPKGTPKVEFFKAGNKWMVENQGEGVVTVEVTDPKHSVYIFGCVGATVDVKGKCKLVCIDSCKKIQVLVDDVISSVETVNCQRMKVQVRGMVPSVAIDKTDGFLCYLSKDGLETTFTTSKSSEMNVSFPKPGSTDHELMEMPIPEQFVHRLLNPTSEPKITSEVSDLYSG
jgi:adenylyl cyclase-associated protein